MARKGDLPGSIANDRRTPPLWGCTMISFNPFRVGISLFIGYPGLDPGLFTFLALWAKENIYVAGYFICLSY